MFQMRLAVRGARRLSTAKHPASPDVVRERLRPLISVLYPRYSVSLVMRMSMRSPVALVPTPRKRMSVGVVAVGAPVWMHRSSAPLIVHRPPSPPRLLCSRIPLHVPGWLCDSKLMSTKEPRSIHVADEGAARGGASASSSKSGRMNLTGGSGQVNLWRKAEGG